MNNYKDTEALTGLYESIIYGNILNEESPSAPLSDLDRKAMEEINKAVERVQESDIFFSKIIASMGKFIDRRGDTMSTDGKNLNYNPEYVKTLVEYGGNESVQGVIVHEILHIAFGHHIAFAKELDEAIRTNNEKLKWIINVACDLAINSFLVGRTGFPKDVFIPGVNPNEEPFKDFPKNKDSRWYFNQLMDFYKNKKEDDQEDQGDQGEQGEQDDQGKQDDQGDQGGDQGDQTDQKGQSGDQGEDGDQGKQGGSGEGEESGESDEGVGKGAGKGSESEGEGEGSGEGGSSSGSLSETKDFDIPEDLMDKYKKTGEILPPQDLDESKIDNAMQEHDQEIKEMQKDAKKTEDVKKQRGKSGSGGAYSNIDYLGTTEEKSKIPWKRILQDFLTQNERGEVTYRRPSRRMSGMNFSDFYSNSEEEIRMPSRYEEKLNELIFIVDVSGSNQEAASKIFPELREAINSSEFGNESTLRLVSFNSGIEDEYVFTFNPKDYQSLKNTNQKVPKENIIVPQGKNLLSDDDFNKFKWRVGGGTRIKPVFDALNRLREKPPFIVILTDGEFFGEDIKMINSGDFPFEIIWIMTKDKEINLKGRRTYKTYEMDY